MYNVFLKIKSLFPLWSYEWKRACEQSDVCGVAAGVGGSFDWVQPDQSPFNKVAKETLLLHDVLPHMLLQGALETPRAGPNTGATRRGCEHLSEELLTPWRWGAPPPRPPFPSPSPGPSVTERTAVNTQHGFNKAYNLRNQCSECQWVSAAP